MNEDSEDLNNPNLSGCDRLLTSPGSASDNGGTINTGTTQLLLVKNAKLGYLGPEHERKPILMAIQAVLTPTQHSQLAVQSEIV